MRWVLVIGVAACLNYLVALAGPHDSIDSYSWSMRGVAVTRIQFSTFPSPPPARRVDLTHVAAGWPSPSLEGWRWRIDGAPTYSGSIAIATGTSPPSRSDYGIVFGQPLLPLRPRWGGFALNTIIYAVALALPVIGIRSIRRCVLTRSGRCVECAHTTNDDGACPECGRGYVDESVSIAGAAPSPPL